jgi:hypothetical protein
MRSPVVGVLAVLGLAAAVVLVAVLFQTIGLRSDLEATRGELVSLRAQVEGVERGVPLGELSLRLAELENDIRDWVAAFGGSGPAADPSGAGTGASSAEVLDRLDELLERIDALDERIDEICAGVPVC